MELQVCMEFMLCFLPLIAQLILDPEQGKLFVDHNNLFIAR